MWVCGNSMYQRKGVGIIAAHFQVFKASLCIAPYSSLSSSSLSPPPFSLSPPSPLGRFLHPVPVSRCRCQHCRQVCCCHHRDFLPRFFRGGLASLPILDASPPGASDDSGCFGGEGGRRGKSKGCARTGAPHSFGSLLVWLAHVHRLLGHAPGDAV